MRENYLHIDDFLICQSMGSNISERLDRLSAFNSIAWFNSMQSILR